jgi:hypothetical protein
MTDSLQIFGAKLGLRRGVSPHLQRLQEALSCPLILDTPQMVAASEQFFSEPVFGSPGV